MRRQVKTYYLEMNDSGELRAARAVVAELKIRQAQVPAPELNRFLYAAVGGDWFWIDRLSWSYERWFEYLNRPELETWVAYLCGTPAGYFELERQGDDVELAYFGLLQQFIGRGIGGLLLTRAIERAWAWGARRVWLHTLRSLPMPRSTIILRAASAFTKKRRKRKSCRSSRRGLGPGHANE